jgi:hypothetical protein
MAKMMKSQDDVSRCVGESPDELKLDGTSTNSKRNMGTGRAIQFYSFPDVRYVLSALCALLSVLCSTFASLHTSTKTTSHNAAQSQ